MEEEDALRRSMWCCLEEEGYQVLEANTSEHAELVAAAYRRPISVLVTGLDGAQLAQCLKKRHPKLQTLYLSGYRHDQTGIPGALLKPFSLTEFRRRIRALAASDSRQEVAP